ncbi:MAG: hypothetical protein L0H55_10715 [Candidatus Nitrosocosmicus sp.]|nr:hypothetical protein [Candidatus Nitrosocosmicus sp.]
MQTTLVVTAVIFLIITAVTTTITTAFAQINVLSHRFETTGLPGVIGEIQNNGTRSHDKYDVDIVANFRDVSGTLISSESGYIDAETLGPGDSSAFQVSSFDDTLPDTASTYDLIVNDERVVVGAPVDGDSNSNSNSNDDEGDSND